MILPWPQFGTYQSYKITVQRSPTLITCLLDHLLGRSILLASDFLFLFFCILVMTRTQRCFVGTQILQFMLGRQCVQNLTEPWHRSSETKTLRDNLPLGQSRTKLGIINREKKLGRRKVTTSTILHANHSTGSC